MYVSGQLGLDPKVTFNTKIASWASPHTLLSFRQHDMVASCNLSSMEQSVLVADPIQAFSKATGVGVGGF